LFQIKKNPKYGRIPASLFKQTVVWIGMLRLSLIIFGGLEGIQEMQREILEQY